MPELVRAEKGMRKDEGDGMSRPSYNPDCEACIHKRICDIWGEHECQDAACYVNDCFEPMLRPCSNGAPAEREDTEVDVSYLTRKLIKRLDEICVMEMPEDWLTGHPEQFRLRVLAGVKDAACLVAAALRVMEEEKKHE